MTPLHGIACFYDVGFGARAVSRKTPIYFIIIIIYYHLLLLLFIIIYYYYYYFIAYRPQTHSCDWPDLLTGLIWFGTLCSCLQKDKKTKDKKTKRQKGKKTKRQKDNKTKRQKDNKKHTDKKTKRQKEKKTTRHKDKKTERQQDKKTTKQKGKKTLVSCSPFALVWQLSVSAATATVRKLPPEYKYCLNFNMFDPFINSPYVCM